MKYLNYITVLLSILLFTACTTHKQYQLEGANITSADQAATLHVPARLQLMAVNGEAVPKLSNRLGMADAEIIIPAGRHEIKTRYRDIWDIGDADFAKVNSKPVYLTLNAERGRAYQLSFSEPESYEAAKRFAKKPSFSILEVGKAEIQQVKKTTQMASKEQPKIARTIEDLPQTQTSTVNKKIVASSDTSPQQPKSAFNNLKSWWDKATPAEKAEFQRWVWAKPRS